MNDSSMNAAIVGLSFAACALVCLNVSMRPIDYSTESKTPAPSEIVDDTPQALIQLSAYTPAPESVARSFGEAKRPVDSPPTPATIAPLPADWLRFIGDFEDGDGVQWLFFKNSRNARVLKIRIDRTSTEAGRLVEMNTDTYILEIGGAQYSVRRK